MKRLWMPLIVLCLLLAAGHALAACDPAMEAVQAKIEQLQNSLEQQLERVQDARNRSATRMSDARRCILDALTQSQDDLKKQIAGLESLREQLAIEREKSDQAAEKLRDDWSQRFAASLSSIESQLSGVNSLIQKLESVQEQVSTGDDPLPALSDLPKMAMPTSTDPFALDPITTDPVTTTTTTTPVTTPTLTPTVTPTTTTDVSPTTTTTTTTTLTLPTTTTTTTVPTVTTTGTPTSPLPPGGCPYANSHP